ncbi:MAG: hypothetical protein V4590_10870 [Bacteroidota bacterium]
MKLLYTLALLILSSAILSAQVPGYLGKKLSAGYRVDVSPVGANSAIGYGNRFNYDGTEQGILSFGFIHSLDLEYVFSRKVALRFSYGISRNGMVGTIEDAYEESEPEFVKKQYPKLSHEYDRSNNDERDYDYMNMDNSLMKVGLTFTRGNYIAPHGRAHSLYLLSHTANCNYVLGDKSSLLTTITGYGLMYERTSRRIIKDCVLLEYGFSFGYLFGAGFGGNPSAETAAKYVTGYQNTQFMFQGTLGIRYLAPKFGR